MPRSRSGGNILTGGGRENTWDSQNRLVQCVTSGATSSFTYGADGLRRSMTVDNGTTATTTDYLLDGQNVVQEMRETVSGGITTLTPTATYLAGPRGVEYRQDESTGQRSWYLYDGLGSVLAEVDEGATFQPFHITATHMYDVYGALRPNPDPGTSASSHKFVGGIGHQSDDATGLTYMRTRYYDPAMGRFISEDRKKSSRNWYAYCDNNPTNAFDFSGCTAGTIGDTLNTVKSGMALEGMGCSTSQMAYAALATVMAIIAGRMVRELQAVSLAMGGHSIGGNQAQNKDFERAMKDLGINKSDPIWRQTHEDIQEIDASIDIIREIAETYLQEREDVRSKSGSSEGSSGDEGD